MAFDEFSREKVAALDKLFLEERLRFRSEKSSVFPTTPREVVLVGIQRGYSGEPCQDTLSEIERETKRRLEGRPPCQYKTW